MKRLLGVALIGMGLLLVGSGEPLGAQVPLSLNPRTRPPVSPYFYLGQPGTDPAFSYYGVVRPEVNFRRSILGLQQEQSALAAQQQEMATGGLAPTGHATSFMTQSKYFMTKGARPTSFAPTPSGIQSKARGATRR
jgi:hypothetical protein